ncbi:MAG TPA: DUF3794 domain-containing protein [Symbiobacteriaceae bacterium]|nr:DUF3794 domain-containing protein [Symbiobacteriaceae bacterium]
MRSFEVFEVVGSGNVEELICQTITLPTSAEEIKEIRKTVIIDNCRVIFNKVIIDGRLRKDIMFKAANAGFPQPGTVQGCGGSLTTVSGAIQDIDVDFAFTALIPVKGACPDDHCVVLQAFVEGEKEEAADIQETGAFNSLIDKSVVFICVKVVRDTVTDLKDRDGFDDNDSSDHSDHSDSSDHSDFSDSSGSGRLKSKRPMAKKKDRCGDKGTDHLCPKVRSTGVFPGSKRIPAPKPGLIPGTWIGPTLVFPGVLNPGIPSTSPVANVIVNPAGNQIQITDRGNR